MSERSGRTPDRSEVTDETYLPLTLACRCAERFGVMYGLTVKSLRRESSRDRLAIYRFCGRDHTTLGDIKRMMKECLVIGGKDAEPKPSDTRKPEAHLKVSKAAALLAVERLKQRCSKPPSGRKPPMKR